MEIVIRELKPEERYRLKDLLYEAIYQPDEEKKIPRSILEIPEVNAYIKDFGELKDDYCMVADLDGEIIGGVWIRILSGETKGYGNIDDKTPEFAISLFEPYRNQGIGGSLMIRMIDYLREKGYTQATLNVKKENYAVKLYKKVGFKVIGEDAEDYLMVLDLN